MGFIKKYLRYIQFLNLLYLTGYLINFYPISDLLIHVMSGYRVSIIMMSLHFRFIITLGITVLLIFSLREEKTKYFVNSFLNNKIVTVINILCGIFVCSVSATTLFFHYSIKFGS